MNFSIAVQKIIDYYNWKYKLYFTINQLNNNMFSLSNNLVFLVVEIDDTNIQLDTEKWFKTTPLFNSNCDIVIFIDRHSKACCFIDKSDLLRMIKDKPEINRVYRKYIQLSDEILLYSHYI